MRLLKIALFLCVVTGQLEGTLAQTNECVGPPPLYNNSAYDHCVANQATGGCNCTDPNQTCSFGDQLWYACSHDRALDFIIVCDRKDGQGNFGFISLVAGRDEFKACTGSPPPVASTPPPAQTFPPSVCSKFNNATWPPEGCIRLIGSHTMPHETTGILQVYFNNTWGSVCFTGIWTQDTLVDIACRMLGFNRHGSFSALQLAIPAGLSNDAWMVNIQHTCPGTVNSLWDCARTEPCWLTYAVGGSGICPTVLNISCEVQTTFPDLTSCPPPTTTTPNPTTSGPDVSTHVHHLEDIQRTTVSGHESSPNTGLPTGAIVGIAVASVFVVGVVALFVHMSGICKGSAQGSQTQQPNERSRNPARADTTPPAESGPVQADNGQAVEPEEPHDPIDDAEDVPAEGHNDPQAAAAVDALGSTPRVYPINAPTESHEMAEPSM
ncbi:uncharacterized protein [Branchiostoma lanceolatum]|uniref:uncharacterized protein n=1 Tax=Branchiostoma lanceolatum TaxID=7740 RepID=UPI003453EED8